MSPEPDASARREEIEAPLNPARYGALRRLAEDPRQRLVLSLGGGSVPALCGNAVLLGLVEELGLAPRVAEVWGTSAGAVIGASWASGVTARELIPLGKRFARPETLDVPRLRIALSLLLSPFGKRLPDGLVRGKRIRAALSEMIRAKRFEDLKVPFRCIATTDDGQARRKVFRRGPLLPAVYASLSVPGVIAPGEPFDESPGGQGGQGGQAGQAGQGDTRGARGASDEGSIGYLDGGLVEKTPLLSPIAEHRQRGSGERLLILAAHYGAAQRRPAPRGFIRRFLHAIDALENLAWGYQLAHARSQPDVSVLLLDSGIADGQLFNFERIDLSLLEARAALRRQLDDAHLAGTLGGGG